MCGYSSHGQGLVSYALVLFLLVGGIMFLVLTLGGWELLVLIVNGFILLWLGNFFGKYLYLELKPLVVIIATALHLYQPPRREIVPSWTVLMVVKQYHTLLKKRGIQVHYASKMPYAIGYELFVREIFAHLLSNAIKYTPRTTVNPTIEIYAETLVTTVKYCVRDQGIGISHVHQPHVFNWFYRVRYGRTLGWGIGLSVVRLLVGWLNGECGVESTLGEGAIFWFTLPKS